MPQTHETASPMRTPMTTPYRSIRIPPTIGPTRIGKRLTTDCTAMPIACCSRASVVATSEKAAGSEKQVHERKRNMPAMTAAQCGTTATSA